MSELTLAFLADWEPDGEIYRIQGDGSGLVRITDNTTWEALPKWSPDGRQLAYIDDRLGTSRLAVSDADGSNASVVAPDIEATWEIVWSPSGRQVVFRSGVFVPGEGDLFAVDVQTGEAVNLTFGASFAPGPPSFSPEGDRMTISALMPDSAGPPDYRLFTLWADGTELTEIRFRGNVLLPPMWHPSSDVILFQGEPQGVDVGLYVATLDGSLSRLKSEPRYLWALPSWSPDGTMIAYLALESDQGTALHIATENEEVDERVLDADIAGVEYLSINRYFWAPDSRHIAFFDSGGDYRSDAIFVFDICEGQPRMVVEEVDPDSQISWRPLP